MRALRRLIRALPRAWQRAIVRRKASFDERDLEGVTVRVANSVDDYVAAARLVHDGYVAKGLAQPHASGVRMTPFLALPTTIIFVAHRAGELVGTMSLVGDSALGLPMEKIYGPEVIKARSTGRRLAEVGALCIAPSARGLGVAYLLNKAMITYATSLGIEELLIAVHPDAAVVYETLCFEAFGPVRQYPSLNRSALAVGLCFRLSAYVELTGRAYGHLPADNANPHYLYCHRADPQIQLPQADARPQLAMIHRRAAMKLAALRPDIVRELSHSEFQLLQRELLPASCG